jgi:hypothetical protein
MINVTCLQNSAFEVGDPRARMWMQRGSSCREADRDVSKYVEGSITGKTITMRRMRVRGLFLYGFVGYIKLAQITLKHQPRLRSNGC